MTIVKVTAYGRYADGRVGNLSAKIAYDGPWFVDGNAEQTARVMECFPSFTAYAEPEFEILS
jgi:hypothetical protein